MGLAGRRWALATGGIGALCCLPALIGAWPVSLPASARDLDPARLRDLILASDVPYSGFAESHGTLGLPDLPALGAVAALLGERTQLRAWYASPERWRVDVLTAAGERDTYAAGDGTVGWDYERNLLSRLVGEPALRLPRAADLVPPALARRLLGPGAFAAPGADGDEPAALERLPPRRVAGVAAAGLRVRTDDPDTTVDHVDVWADPATGLPVEVRVTGKAGGAPGLTTRFLDLATGPGSVSDDVVTPPDPSGARRATAAAPQINDYIDRYAAADLPDRLAGRERNALAGEGSRAVRTYGEGFATFAVAALPGRLGQRAYQIASRAEADEVDLTPVPGVQTATAVVLATPLLTLVITQPEFGDGFLLAGPVTADLLLRAAAELPR